MLRADTTSVLGLCRTKPWPYANAYTTRHNPMYEQRFGQQILKVHGPPVICAAEGLPEATWNATVQGPLY